MTGVLFIQRIDPQLKHDFKTMCANEDTTLTQAISDLITEALERGYIQFSQSKTSCDSTTSAPPQLNNDVGPPQGIL